MKAIVIYKAGDAHQLQIEERPNYSPIQNNIMHL